MNAKDYCPPGCLRSARGPGTLGEPLEFTLPHFPHLGNGATTPALAIPLGYHEATDLTMLQP